MKSQRSKFQIYAAGAILVASGLAILTLFGTSIARGWLCAFVLISMVPIGSLALLLVHGITGGRWGQDLASLLVPAARAMPLLLVVMLPIMLFRSLIYPWPGPGVPEEVARFYLNPPFFDARAILALGLWSVLAWREAWTTPLSAALGLVVHLVLTTFIPADWILTLEPGTSSAAFGLSFGIEQIFAALAFAAVCAPQADEPRANRDLAGLILSALLGTGYFVYVQFVIIWYGNIPDKVQWYVTRSSRAWLTIAFIAFLLETAIPFLTLLSPAARQSRAALRIVGGLVLTGIALHIAWLTVPILGEASLLPAFFVALAISLLVAAMMKLTIPREFRDRA